MGKLIVYQCCISQLTNNILIRNFITSESSWEISIKTAVLVARSNVSNDVISLEFLPEQTESPPETFSTVYIYRFNNYFGT